MKKRKNVETTSPVVKADDLDPHEISVLAYSYWQARGFRDGSPEEDWLRAVEELRQRHGVAELAAK